MANLFFSGTKIAETTPTGVKIYNGLVGVIVPFVIGVPSIRALVIGETDNIGQGAIVGR